MTEPRRQYKKKPDLAPIKTDWNVVKALWNKSFSRSDFRVMVNYHTSDVGNVAEAMKWSEQQEHPSEVGKVFVRSREEMR